MPNGIACVVILVAVLAALAAVESPTSQGTDLGVETAVSGGTDLGVAEALAEFSKTGAERSLLSAGQLGPGTHWVHVGIAATQWSGRRYVKFEALRLKRGDFWTFAKSLDGDWAIIDEPAWFATRDGVALPLPLPAGPEQDLRLLGRIAADSYNRPRAVAVEAAALHASQFRFERMGGLLLGSMLMLSAFSLLIAILVRDRVYFLFAAWLITSLRVAAQNGGWDSAWLGLSLDTEEQRTALRLTLIAHFAVSLGLFEALFRVELRRLGWTRDLWLLLALVLATTLTAGLLPAHDALIAVWTCGVVSIAFVTVVLIQVLRKQPTAIAWWYALSWGIAAGGLIGQMGYASGALRDAPVFFNSQVSALASALVMAVALAARVREDRAARIAAQNSEHAALRRFRESYEAMPVGVFSMHFDGTIIEYNPAFAAMFGLGPPRPYAPPPSWPAISSPHALEALVQATRNGSIADLEIVIPSTHGARRWLHVRALPKPDRLETWIEDVTARKAAERRLQFLADHDSLTGLLNRRGVNPHLERAIVASGERNVCFAYIDLDRFKLINDLFGHAAGDQILRQLATRTRDLISPPHVVARVGGDEFVVIIHDLSLAAALDLCETLRRALSNRAYLYHDKELSIAASIGVIELAPHMSPRDALTAADRACAEAKRSGSASVIAFDCGNAELSAYLEEVKLVADMRERLPLERFFTQLQPIVSLTDPDSCLCYEVLVRMRDPSGALIPPGRFIKAAERNGLMGNIDRWVIRSTLEWLDANLRHVEGMCFCTVNLSGASLNDQKFLEDIIALIREHPRVTSKICFEITESVALYDLNATRRFVDRVKSFGARIALDDFGAGYTSFNYLKELSGDLLKIDGSLVCDIDRNPSNFAISAAIVELAHQIGMACVAEWVESAETLRALIDLKVDYAQGFGLCAPLDSARVLRAGHAMELVNDPRIVELLGRNTARPKTSNGAASRTLLSP